MADGEEDFISAAELPQDQEPPPSNVTAVQDEAEVFLSHASPLPLEDQSTQEVIEDMDSAQVEEICTNIISQTEDQSDDTQCLTEILDYNLNQSPKLLTYTRIHSMENYFRGCKWSPDGTCIIACTNDNHLRLYNLPSELYASVPNEVLPQLALALSSKEGEIIYDYCWFPLMSSQDISTCCFASCSRSSPVHLWDAYDGCLRCSYLSFNHLEELVSPYSLSFSNCGTKLYVGFENFIKIFDTGKPGRESTTRWLYKRKEGGQNGIISSIAMDPVTQGNYALGSYAGSVSIHSDLTSGPLFLIHGLHNGVTHLAYSPDGTYLFSGERKSPNITCWDLRQPCKVYRQFNRTVETNQRIYFDISKNGKWLVSAATSGDILFWDLSSAECEAAESEVQDCFCQFKMHEDSVNGCSLHPVLPILATSSGQWKFVEADDEDSDDEEAKNSISYDNSLKLWSLMGQTTGEWHDL